MKTSRFLPFLATLVLAAMMAGCGSSSVAAATPTATATATATATPSPSPTPALGSSYTPTDKFYTLNYPATWQLKPLSASGIQDFVSILSPDTLDDFIILTATGTTSTDQLSPNYQGFLQSLPATNIKLDPSVQSAPFGANTWQDIGATFTSNNIAYSGDQFYLSHGGRSVFVYTLAPTSAYVNVGTTIYGPLLTSVVFG